MIFIEIHQLTEAKESELTSHHCGLGSCPGTSEGEGSSSQIKVSNFSLILQFPPPGMITNTKFQTFENTGIIDSFT